MNKSCNHSSRLLSFFSSLPPSFPLILPHSFPPSLPSSLLHSFPPFFPPSFLPFSFLPKLKCGAGKRGLNVFIKGDVFFDTIFFQVVILILFYLLTQLYLRILIPCGGKIKLTFEYKYRESRKML